MMPGVGPLTALSIEAFAPEMSHFRRGRNFAVSVGLVPRQHSPGGKDRLGRMSRDVQADIRRLLIIGAMSRLSLLGRLKMAAGSWLAVCWQGNSDARGDRAGQQDGAADLGDAEEAAGFPRAGDGA